MKKKKDTDSRETNGKMGLSLKKVLIIVALIFSIGFLVNGMFDIVSGKVESMTQEEKDEINGNWDGLMDFLRDE